MNKVILIKKLAVIMKIKEKEASLFLEQLLNICSQSLIEGDSVRLSGFGTLKTRYRKGRIGYLPKTKKEVKIPEGRIAMFCASKKLREQLLEPDTTKNKKTKISKKSQTQSPKHEK